MLLPPHNHMSYVVTNGSVGAAIGANRGTAITAGAANTAGTWTQIHEGLTYGADYFTIAINAVRTSGNVIAATNLNCYLDIGVGATSGAVMTVCEKLAGVNGQGLGINYFIPVRIPPDTPVWARHTNNNASAIAAVQVSWFGGNMNPGCFPSFAGMVALGATTASTTGTAITPGASGAEGSWTQIVASTTADYGGLMASPLFNVDTALLVQYTTIDVGVGASGQEKVVGENVTQQSLPTTGETKDAICFPVWTGIPSGSRLVARASGSGTAETSNSIMLYGFIH